MHLFIYFIFHIANWFYYYYSQNKYYYYYYYYILYWHLFILFSVTFPQSKFLYDFCWACVEYRTYLWACVSRDFYPHYTVYQSPWLLNTSLLSDNYPHVKYPVVVAVHYEGTVWKHIQCWQSAVTASFCIQVQLHTTMHTPLNSLHFMGHLKEVWDWVPWIVWHGKYSSWKFWIFGFPIKIQCSYKKLKIAILI